MPVIRGIVIGLVGIAVLIAVAACLPAQANPLPSGSGDRALWAEGATPTPPPLDDIVWGRVPYCTCLTGSATAAVADALKNARLTVTLEELSPRDGWLYFAAIFDPHSVTRDQVDAALVAGGAQVIDGPP